MITSGTIRYEDGVKAAEDFAPARKAMVELTFEVPEGGDATAEADRAQAEAITRVHEMLGVKVQGKTRKRNDAAVREAANPEQPKAETAGTVNAPPSAPTEQVAPKEVGNDDLLGAVTRKNAEINDAPRILTLMATFIPAGTQAKVQNIPQDKRQAFLDALALVTK